MRINALIRLLVFTGLLLGLVGAPPAIQAQEVTTSAAAEALGIAAGVHLRPSVTYGSDLHAFNTQVGKNAAIIMWFADFVTGNDFFLYDKLNNTQQLPAQEKPVIMLTLEPKNGRQANGCDRDYSGFIGYDAMIAGRCDTFIRNLATAMAQRPAARFLIRFAHEMNISDSPYWPGHSGKTPADYIQMYRRVYQVFTAAQDAAGVRNAEFVWSPNYFSQPAEAWNYYYQYYPGDNYVDWIGVSGYNWYPYQNEPNRSFKQIFGDLDGTDAYYSDQGFHPGILYDISCRYAKPIILAEIGAAHRSGTAQQKADWILDAYRKLAAHPFVRAVVWFNDYAYAGNEINFRVTGVESEITNAYKTALQSSAYRSTLPALADATPPARYCWTDVDKAGQPVYRLSRTSVTVKPNSRFDVSVSGILVPDDPTVSVAAMPGGVAAALIEDGLSAPWGDALLRFTTAANTPLGTHTVIVRVSSLQGVYELPLQLQVVDKLYEARLPLVIR